MWFRLKNHLIWTPKDFPFIRQSCTKKPVADWNRPSGMRNPPERIHFSLSDQWWCGRLRSTPFWFKLRTAAAANAETVLLFFSSSSLSLSKVTIHLLLPLSTSLFPLSTHLLTIWTPDSDSPRRRALGSTLRSKLHRDWIFGLLKFKVQTNPSPFYILKVGTPWL